MTRRNARELALQILFQREFMPSADPNELFDLFQDHLALEKTEVGYARDLVGAVLANEAAIDAIIQKYSLNWNIKRL